MSYQVLARKYRPRTFQTMIGQEHVLRALINALEQNRLHHAYLFTGTRGVGKTTVARLLAKCMNCELGVSANPCNQCNACQEINEGRFVDLLEVDAASRTRVEDTRELLENVQYAPTRGRFKVYLIDEVHMLSGHSFNALLKTLEEPPPHVKFLLATTDPQRLPITVLSRCLQFNLKNLSPELIQQHLVKIIQQENIVSETPALIQLARAANGSVRDALSLLDQAIAYGGGQLKQADVQTMLGAIESTHIIQLLKSLSENDARALVDEIKQLAEKGVDFTNVLEELLSVLHRIAVTQLIPDSLDVTHEQYTEIAQLAKQISREDIQLYYQIGLIGRRDLPLAPSARTGFEMIMLRMLAFKPIDSLQHPADSETKQANSLASLSHAHSASNAVGQSIINKSTNIKQKLDGNSHDTATKPVVSPAINSIPSNELNWPKIVEQLNLNGFTQALASHCTLKSYADSTVHLIMDSTQSALRNARQEARLAEALSIYFGKSITLQISNGSSEIVTPAKLLKQQQVERIKQVTQNLAADPTLKHIMQTFDAKIQPDSIQAKTVLPNSEIL